MYANFEHDIPQASELALAKIEDSNIVSKNSCNEAWWINGLLMDKINIDYNQLVMNETITNTIVG